MRRAPEGGTPSGGRSDSGRPDSSVPMRNQDLPGRHITDSQMTIDMKFRQSDTPARATAKADFSASSGYRIERDRRLPFRKQVKRGRRRPNRLAAVWESEIVPMLPAAPGLRVVAVFEEMRRRHPEISPGIRRTLERRNSVLARGQWPRA
jgi:hypothetical protein